jgi:hypothetical protein
MEINIYSMIQGKRMTMGKGYLFLKYHGEEQSTTTSVTRQALEETKKKQSCN